MPKRDLTIAMVGAGGDGIVTMGDVLAQAAAREGLNVLKTEAYGPQIRGGESSCVVRLSADPIYESGDAIDVVVVFSWADFARFKGEVMPAKNSVVLSDEADPIARTPEDLGTRAVATSRATPSRRPPKSSCSSTSGFRRWAARSRRRRTSSPRSAPSSARLSRVKRR